MLLESNVKSEGCCRKATSRRFADGGQETGIKPGARSRQTSEGQAIALSIQQNLVMRQQVGNYGM
jgi:hypothetical protein